MTKKKRSERFRCDQIEGERFYAANDDVFRYNWWEVFCFPYILCSRVWDCCVSLCAGTNQCLVYWMALQWLICKITRMTTPDPIMYPYFFYLFCQVILLTIFFVFVWIWIGKKLVIPYFETIFNALSGENDDPSMNLTRLSFRKYCFRKSELFDVPYDKNVGVIVNLQSSGVRILTVLVDAYLYYDYF